MNWELRIHTCDDEGNQLDSSAGDDWTIYCNGEAVLWEGEDCRLTLGEVRSMFTVMQKCTIPLHQDKVTVLEHIKRWYRGLRWNYFPNKSDKEFKELLNSVGK